MKRALALALSLAPLACAGAEPAPVAPIAPSATVAPPPVAVDPASPPPAPGAPAPKATDGQVARTQALIEAAQYGSPGALKAAMEPGGPRGNPPKIRIGAVTVSGPLPPEVVQRIVRQTFGRFRLCYEEGLRANSRLEGTVSVKFTIEKDGTVSAVGDGGGSTLPDPKLVTCVARGFAGLSFPEPDGGGTVAVVYPMTFSPPDAAKAPAKKP